MPRVITPVNLDFDDKEEFKRRYGEGSLSVFLRQCIREKLEAEKNEKPLVDFSAMNTINISHSKYITIMDDGIPRLYDDLRKWEMWAMSLNLEQARNFNGRIKWLKWIAGSAEMNQQAKHDSAHFLEDIQASIANKARNKRVNKYSGLHIQTPSDVTTAFNPEQEEIVQDDIV